MTLADLNVDGFLDMVTANRSSADASVLFGRPGGLFRAEERFALGGQPDALMVADLNADDLPDIITTSSQSDNASFVLSTTFRRLTVLPNHGELVGQTMCCFVRFIPQLLLIKKRCDLQ